MEVDEVVNPSANPYEPIIINIENDEDIQCDVCLELEYEDDD
jgi:hypothetical protein